jgi:dephospho-CoA kinase
MGMLKVGLTGGIGCGKTAVANLFAALGVPVIDADVLARRLVEPGQPAFRAIVEHFGEQVVTHGQLDRSQLRQRVFAQQTERRWLEQLLHPLIFRGMQQQTENFRTPYCLLIIPLLLETGRRDFVDRLLVVDCLPELQRQRVKQRDGLDDAAFDRIVSAQVSREERLAAADDLIENNAAADALAPRVEALHRLYIGLSGGARS